MSQRLDSVGGGSDGGGDRGGCSVACGTVLGEVEWGVVGDVFEAARGGEGEPSCSSGFSFGRRGGCQWRVWIGTLGCCCSHCALHSGSSVAIK